MDGLEESKAIEEFAEAIRKFNGAIALSYGNLLRVLSTIDDTEEGKQKIAQVLEGEEAADFATVTALYELKKSLPQSGIIIDDFVKLLLLKHSLALRVARNAPIGQVVKEIADLKSKK